MHLNSRNLLVALTFPRVAVILVLLLWTCASNLSLSPSHFSANDCIVLSLLESEFHPYHLSQAPCCIVFISAIYTRFCQLECPSSTSFDATISPACPTFSHTSACTIMTHVVHGTLRSLPSAFSTLPRVVPCISGSIVVWIFKAINLCT
jgi:hypothetical protein